MVLHYNRTKSLIAVGNAFRQGRCENPECRNMAEYHGICRNITEYAGISRNIPKHHNIFRWLTTYFITKVMDLSHFDGK